MFRQPVGFRRVHVVGLNYDGATLAMCNTMHDCQLPLVPFPDLPQSVPIEAVHDLQMSEQRKSRDTEPDDTTSTPLSSDLVIVTRAPRIRAAKVDRAEWSTDDAFALEMQSPWAEALLSGSKTVETRAYDLPPALLRRKIHILQSPHGTDGVSSLDDEFRIDSSVAQVTGWCVFCHT